MGKCMILLRRATPDDKLKLHFEAFSQLQPDEQRTIMDGMLLKHVAKRYINRAISI